MRFCPVGQSGCSGAFYRTIFSVERHLFLLSRRLSFQVASEIVFLHEVFVVALKLGVVCQELCKISEGEVSFGGTEIRLRFRLRTTA